MSSDAGRESRLPTRWILLASLVAAALLRLEYMRELAASPFGGHLLLDAEWFDQAARIVLGGGSFADGVAYFRPPLYPLFVAALYAVSDASVWAVRGVQWSLGLVQVLLCWGIARRTHGERVAALVAPLAATYGMFIYFEGELLSTALGVVVTSAAVYLLLEGDHRASWWRFGAGGLALGLAAILHGTALVLAPVAVLWALWSSRRWVAALALALGVSIPVGVVTARNWEVTGEPVLVASQAGINFYVGNNGHSDGKSALAPGFAEAGQVLGQGEYRDTVEIAGRTLAEREMGRSLTAAEVNRYWFERAGDWIRDEPKAALALFARKLIFFWDGYEISNNRDLADQANRFTPILRVFLMQWTVLLPFGLLGAFAAGRNRSRALLLLLLAVYSLAIASFFVCSRFRQPAVAWMLPFVAAGMLRTWERVRHVRERPRSAAITLVSLVALFVVTNGSAVTALRIADVTSATDAPFHRFNLAVVFEREGDLDRAIEEYRAAAATGVADPRVHLNLGNTLARTGRIEEAREAYRTAIRIAPDFAPAVRCNLGIVAAQQGDWTEAIRQFEECVSLDPGHLNGLIGLSSAYMSSGRFDEAIVTLRRALAQPGAPEALLRRNLAVAYLETGLLEDAEREGTAALRLEGDDVASMLTLGKTYVRLGRNADAQRMWAKARETAPGAPGVEQAIADAQRRER